ncbi:hypothetical protein F5Y18DRAFT_322424 [Xylariaceae sp. FL1019]|nr:hypothetical protein F5Y18DRAFT_322424 [Xylariaceae sp. FL1019]
MLLTVCLLLVARRLAVTYYRLEQPATVEPLNSHAQVKMGCPGPYHSIDNQQYFFGSMKAVAPDAYDTSDNAKAALVIFILAMVWWFKFSSWSPSARRQAHATRQREEERDFEDWNRHLSDCDRDSLDPETIKCQDMRNLRTSFLEKTSTAQKSKTASRRVPNVPRRAH